MKNELQNKLADYEAAPPPHVWAEIEGALDNQAAPHATLLYQFEQVPPPHVWNKIEQGLEEKNENAAPVRKIHVSRLAAAAAILILVASAITFFIGRQKESGDVAIVTSPGEREKTSGTSADISQPTEKNETTSTTGQGMATAKTRAEVKKDRIPSGRYMTIADEEGKKIRLSKKVASVFDCADNLASVKGVRCKENIESLQQKMSASLLSPSGDFSGLMDMIKSLEENN